MDIYKMASIALACRVVRLWQPIGLSSVWIRFSVLYFKYLSIVFVFVNRLLVLKAIHSFPSVVTPYVFPISKRNSLFPSPRICPRRAYILFCYSPIIPFYRRISIGGPCPGIRSGQSTISPQQPFRFIFSSCNTRHLVGSVIFFPFSRKSVHRYR